MMARIDRFAPSGVNAWYIIMALGDFDYLSG